MSADRCGWLTEPPRWELPRQPGVGRRAMSIDDAALQRAIEWMSRRLQEEPDASRAELIDHASRQFNLTPLQEEFLYRQFGKRA